MTPRDRVWAALLGEPVDRPPVSFWGHVYHRESTAQELVDHTLERYERYGWDWIKLNPRKHYHVEPWGVRYRYPGTPDVKPKLEAWPIAAGDDWATIREVPHDQGALGEQLEAVRMLRARLPQDVPVVQTVFTPLAILGEMTETPQDLKQHLATHPRFILLDEPFAGVDPIAVRDIQGIIHFLRERQIGVLITDHNVRETLKICDRAYIINDGSVLACGAPEEIVYNESVRKVYLGEHFRL